MNVNAPSSDSTQGRGQSLQFDYLLVGGGLQNALVALCLLERNPHANVCLVERESQLGGNHSWCFHQQDLSQALKQLVQPMLSQRWPGYEVEFPALQRSLGSPYALVTSESLHHCVSQRFAAAPRARLLLDCPVETTAPGVFRTSASSGTTLSGNIVVDARGPRPTQASPAVAFQKFLGLEVELQAPCPRTLPLLMDARVEQLDGFRFMYALPLDSRRVLLEDTYYSRSSALDCEKLEHRIRQYAQYHGYQIARVVRRERGVLPLPLRSRPDADEIIQRVGDSIVITGGYAGGWLHPTTGYSFPAAARLAEHIAQTEHVTLEGLQELRRSFRRQWRFATWLNRLLFDGFPPEQSYAALERFYRLPRETIERFYALKTTPSDRLRVLCGRPPRGISAAHFIRNLRQGQRVPGPAPHRPGAPA